MIPFSVTEQPVLQQATVCLEAAVKGQAGYVTMVAIKAEQDPRLNYFKQLL